MADVDSPEVEETEGETVVEEKSGFGFQLSESIVHAIDSQIVSSGLRLIMFCLLYTSPSPRDQRGSRMPSSA